MKKIIILPMLIVSVLILSGCSLYGGTSNAPVPTTQVPAAGDSVSANVINIQNFAFNPASLTVKKGTMVTWINNDSAPHQIKSATLNSSQLSNGQSFSFTFDMVGTFDYSCAIHPSMLGKIIVE